MRPDIGEERETTRPKSSNSLDSLEDRQITVIDHLDQDGRMMIERWSSRGCCWPLLREKVVAVMRLALVAEGSHGLQQQKIKILVNPSSQRLRRDLARGATRDDTKCTAFIEEEDHSVIPPLAPEKNKTTIKILTKQL